MSALEVQELQMDVNRRSEQSSAAEVLLNEIRPFFPEKPEEEQEDYLPDQVPEPTVKQLRQMYKSAAEGRIDNDIARNACVRAFEANGTRGLSDFRNEMNVQLEMANSDYRARLVRADGPNGTVNLYLILQNQRNNESLTDIVRDLHRNGDNSQYSRRAILMELIPQQKPTGPTI